MNANKENTNNKKSTSSINIEEMIKNHRQEAFLESILKEYEEDYDFEFSQDKLKEECQKIEEMCRGVTNECKKFASTLQQFHSTKSKIEQNTEHVKEEVQKVKEYVGEIKEKLKDAEEEMGKYKAKYQQMLEDEGDGEKKGGAVAEA